MSWRKIGTDSIYVTAATVATQLLQWVILTSIAHVDGAKMLGFYALAQAFVLPLQYLAWLSIRQRYLTLQDSDKKLPDLFFLRLAFPAFVFLVAIIGVCIFYRGGNFAYLFGLLLFAKYVEGFYDLMYAVLQKEGTTKRVATLSLYRTLISAALFIFVYSVTLNIYISLLITNVQQMLLLLYLTRVDNSGMKRKLLSRLSRQSTQSRLSLLLELLPLSLSFMVMSLNTSVPRLLLDRMIGAAQLGYFVAVSSFISLGAVAVGSLGQSLLQPLSTAIRERDRRIFWLQLILPMLTIVVICALGALMSIPLGPYLIKFVYGAEFVSISPLLFYGAVASGPMFAASIASLGVFAAHLRNAFFWTQLGAAIFTALGVVVLVPKLRLEGVFIALGLSGLLQIVMSCFLLQRYWSKLLQTPRVFIEENKMLSYDSVR